MTKPLSFEYDYDISENANSKGRDFIKKININFKKLEKALEISLLGIDYRKFAKFKILTPEVVDTHNDKYYTKVTGNKNHNDNNCQYCIDFVIESALTLQSFDFDIETLDNVIKQINEKIKILGNMQS